jgi:predicted dithiol-disulfide oxidoreductase (DUF899 family)
MDIRLANQPKVARFETRCAGSRLISPATSSAVGTLEPVWNLFDMTPEGRGSDWDEQLHYS